MTTDRKADKWIGDLVGSLCDAIIVYPGGWGDSLPDWLKTKVTVERLCENILANKESREVTATDAEVACFLFTASLSAPPSHDWAQIYLYVAGAVMKDQSKHDLPEDMRVDALTEYQWGNLKHLKNWIYQQRVKHRKEKQRGERRDAFQVEEAKEEELETRPVQAAFF